MPKGGTLLVAAYATHPTTSAPGVRPPRGSRVVLEVSDTGVGIDPAARSRVFEPYFTTKGVSDTGLRLANVRRIVRDAGGEIDLESRPGAASTFRIALPVR